MAGRNAGFDRKAFESGIRLAMKMGAPIAESDQAKFYFPAAGTSTLRAADDVPWDPEVAHDRAGKSPVKVDCAVTYAEPADQDTRLGLKRPTRVAVTLLESDYQTVKGFDYMVYGGERYDHRATEAGALFDAGVWTLLLTRSDS